MKYLATISLLFIFSISSFAQFYAPHGESQITQTQSSVDIPHLAFGGSTIHLVYGTNFYYFRFPYTGVSEPITNPVRPVEDAFPVRTDIAVDMNDTNHIAIAYVDYKYDNNTGNSFYGCYLVESFDWGNTWQSPILLDTVQLGNTLNGYQYNLPAVEFNDDGDMFVLWRTDLNHSDTNAVFLSVNKGEKIRVDDPTNIHVEFSINLNVDQDYRNVTVSYAKQEEGNAVFYLRVLQEDNTFGNEILVKNDGQTYLGIDYFTKVIYYDYAWNYIFNDFAHGPQFFISQDFGQSWYLYMSNSTRYTFFNYTAPRGSAEFYTRIYLDDSGNLKYSLKDLEIDWINVGNFNSDSAQVEGYASSFIDYDLGFVGHGQVPFVATAWIDTRTGSEQIFYGYYRVPLHGAVDDQNIPSKFELNQNYPNPFNPTTTIEYSIPNVETLHTMSSNVQLIVYDVLGRKVTTLVNKKQTPGNYSVKFDASNLPSGIYFYTLRSGDFVATKKMILMK